MTDWQSIEGRFNNNPILNNYAAKKSNVEAKAYVLKKKERKPASWKQVRYLSHLLNNEPSDRELDGFIRFANAYHHGPLGAKQLWEAITLLRKGSNSFGNIQSLMALATHWPGADCDCYICLGNNPSVDGPRGKGYYETYKGDGA